jgi:hypothetical protein
MFKTLFAQYRLYAIIGITVIILGMFSHYMRLISLAEKRQDTIREQQATLEALNDKLALEGLITSNIDNIKKEVRNANKETDCPVADSVNIAIDRINGLQ